MNMQLPIPREAIFQRLLDSLIKQLEVLFEETAFTDLIAHTHRMQVL